MNGFDVIAGLVKTRSGLALGPEKQYLVEARLGPIVRRLGLSDLSALAARLNRDSSLEQEVVEAMTTNETLFFRDGKPFDHLGGHILPRLHRERLPGVALKIWSAAASTGQEAYSIAMLIRESQARFGDRPVEIVATDISNEALNRARDGSYTKFEVQRGLPPSYLERYFLKDGLGWRVKQEIRENIRFQHHNLLSDPIALGVFDVIFCRNVLIYFDKQTKSTALRMLTRSLAEDGIVYLGGAETLLGVENNLQPVLGTPGAFRR